MVLNLPPGYCRQLDFTCSNLHPRDCPLGGGNPVFTTLNPSPGTLSHGYSLCLYTFQAFFLFHLVYVLSFVVKSSEDLSISLSLSLSLVEHIASGEAQTGG